MNGTQIESMLNLIDRNIHCSMESVRAEVHRYLLEHGDDLAKEISEKGYGTIPTQLGAVKVTLEDLALVA